MMEVSCSTLLFPKDPHLILDSLFSAMASEKRRLKRIAEKQAHMICLGCRQKGHIVKDCPDTLTALHGNDGERETVGMITPAKSSVGICYRYVTETLTLFLQCSKTYADAGVTAIIFLAAKSPLILKSLYPLRRVLYVPKADILPRHVRRTKGEVSTPMVARVNSVDRLVTLQKIAHFVMQVGPSFRTCHLSLNLPGPQKLPQRLTWC
jgi:hypothetical protein